MFKNIRNSIVTLLSAATLLVVPMAVPALASAQPDIQSNVCGGSTLTVTNTGGCAQTQAGTDSINRFITDIVNVFSVIVGVVAVIMIIVGGFRYITSGGDSNNISSAKNTIIYAIIGLIIVALAQFIVQFVLNKVAHQ
jgi:hypothetical protein